MKSIQSKLLLFSFILTSTASFAQVGIGTTSPDPSAILEVNVSSLPTNAKRGFLPPRLSTPERDAMTAATTPAEGLVIYNTTINCIETYNGATSSWDNYCGIAPRGTVGKKNTSNSVQKIETAVINTEEPTN